jgi:type VI secretion system protein ImpA
MIDLEKLLAPISDDAPTGVDLRAASDDATFSAIDELKRESDPAYDDAGGKDANWPGVVRACEAALATKSKDLQLAALLTEGLARTEGFAGLRQGLELIRGLIERYWDRLHPGLDDGQVFLPVRARPLAWLSLSKDGKGLLPSLRRVPLLGDSRDRAEWLTWEHKAQAELLDATAATSMERYEEMVAAGMCTTDRWRAAQSVTPVERMRELAELLRAIEDDVLRLDQLCEEKFGSDETPSFVELRGLLVDVREYCESQLPKEMVPGASADASGEAAHAAGGGTVSRGPIGSRQDALTKLREVAEFFRRTEPHSPVSHLVERAVRWGHMSFEEVMRDVVKNDTALSEIWETLGIRPGSDGSSEPS